MALQTDLGLLAFVAMASMPSCGKSTNMTANTPTSAGAAAAPNVVLGHGLTPTLFAPGRYATAVQRTLHGTHALQVLNEDSTASFILELASDGAATAWRGWRYNFRNDGPEIHTEERYREQQGYRGRYVVVGGAAEVELSIDNSVCPHVFEGELALARVASMKLRCIRATRGTTPGPVLLCQPIGSKPIELEPHVITQVAPPTWFALGSDHGLRVRLTGRPPGAQEGDEIEATVNVPEVALTPDTWTQAF